MDGTSHVYKPKEYSVYVRCNIMITLHPNQKWWCVAENKEEGKIRLRKGNLLSVEFTRKEVEEYFKNVPW